jgi:hypothetical protein
MKSIRLTQKQLFEKLQIFGVYLYYEFENVCFRTHLSNEKKVISYTKFSNENEFRTNEQSSILYEAMYDPHEITKKEYDTF